MRVSLWISLDRYQKCNHDLDRRVRLLLVGDMKRRVAVVGMAVETLLTSDPP